MPKLTPKQERFIAEYLVDMNATQAALRAGYVISTIPPDQGSYVYFLLDEGRIFYVGKGTGNRMFHHLWDARRGRLTPLRKMKYLAEMLAAGREPVAVTFQTGLNEYDALALERVVIGILGKSTLVNYRSGESFPGQVLLVELEDMLNRFIPYGEWLGVFQSKSGRPPNAFDSSLHGMVLNGLMKERDILIAKGARSGGFKPGSVPALLAMTEQWGNNAI